MENEVLIGLGSILVLGTVAQWLAWRLHLPSILVLLVVGFLAGPVTGFLHPDDMLGEVLFPTISLAVAVILFEGGLSLNIRALKEDGYIIWSMILVGGLVTWILATFGAWLCLGFDFGLAALLGAILIVTGPTVIIPLLLYIRPMGRVGAIAKWEGIVNDPVGAILAVLVFEILIAGEGHSSASLVAWGLLKAFGGGTLIGVAGALIIAYFLKRYWLPDLMHEPVTLMMAIGAFIAANLIQPESGLLAVTVMGIVLGNQPWVSVRHIIEFKERLRVLLIAGLFVLLAARLQMSDLQKISLASAGFVAFLILIVRPAAVSFSTVGARLRRSERLFLAWMAPRGIVAAAVSSVFGLYLAQHGFAGADRLVPEVFFVIVVTVVVYGLTAAPLARYLKLSNPSPQGLLFVSAHKWAREIAKAVRREGFEVMLVDTNWNNVSAAKMEGLAAYNGNIVSPTIFENVAMHSIGRLLAMTRNDEANSLAALRFAEVVGRSNVFQLPPKGADKSSMPLKHLQGRLLFGREFNFDYFATQCEELGRIKTVNLTPRFNYETFKKHYKTAVPLFLITKEKTLVPFTTDTRLLPEPGERLIALVNEHDDHHHKNNNGVSPVKST
ncbi:MAG TPA: cation:proton antiporter [bacterium]|nr:cation:proton antiporter [bacterium]